MGALRVMCVVALVGILAPAARAESLGTWTSAASMPVDRADAAAATLDDGRILVAGGYDGSGNALKSAVLYSPSTNTWPTTTPMPAPRIYAAAASLPGDRALVVGGTDGHGDADPTALIFDGATNAWSAASSPPTALGSPSAAALANGDVLVTGTTEVYPTVVPTTEIYHPATDTWSTASVPPVGRFATAATTLADGRVLVAGGSNGMSEMFGASAAEIYEPGTDSWTSAAPMNDPREHFGLAPLPDGRVVAVGGGGGGPITTGDVEIYDPKANDWFQAQPLPPPAGLPPGFPLFGGRSGPIVAPLPNGQVLVAGGVADATALVFTPPGRLSVAVTTAPRVGANPVVGVPAPAYVALWNASAVTIEIMWQRCRTTCVTVAGPTAIPASEPGPAYVPTAADDGSRLRIVESATDGTSTAVTTSPLSSVVQVPGYHMTADRASASPARGSVQVEVRRDITAEAGTVTYHVSAPTAPAAFAPVEGTLTFNPGQSRFVITIPTVDHGVPILPTSLLFSLSAPSSLPVTQPASELVSLLAPGSSGTVRDPANPLGLGTGRAHQNPLAGASFFVDRTGTPVAKQAAAWQVSDPGKAAMLDQIVDQPNTERYGTWSGPYPGSRVAKYLRRVDQQQPGSVPLLATYRIVRGHCGGWSDSPADAAAYHAWITSLAEGIGTHPAVLFLEMDSIITAPQCLSTHGIAARMHELRDAIDVLSNCPHLVTYLDAGAADALKPRAAARLLKRAGIKQIQGFFLNSTHFDWTRNEIRYGERISKLTGGKHFVINTAENGQGPQRTAHPARQGAEVICNPKNRGLGPKPTTHTGYRNVDAFAWIAHPGVSGGPCTRGAPPIGVFWPAKALSLVRHADYRVR